MNAVRHTAQRPAGVAVLFAVAALAAPTLATGMSGPITVVSPTTGSTIDGSTVVVKIKTSKFKVTNQGDKVRANEGHFHVFLDKRPFVAVYGKVFRFRGLEPGAHTLKVQPVNSAHMPAKGYKTIVVKFRTA